MVGSEDQDTRRILRDLLERVLGSRDHADIQIAAGAALQDLDELEGIAQYEEPIEAAA